MYAYSPNTFKYFPRIWRRFCVPQTTVKGLSHEMDFPLDDMHDSSALNRGRSQFLIFFSAKSVFLAVNASLRWLINVCSVYLVQVSLLLIGQQYLGGSFRYRPLLPIGWRIAQGLRQRRRKMINTEPTTLSAIRNTSSKPIHVYQCTSILHL